MSAEECDLFVKAALYTAHSNYTIVEFSNPIGQMHHSSSGCELNHKFILMHLFYYIIISVVITHLYGIVYLINKCFY